MAKHLRGTKRDKLQTNWRCNYKLHLSLSKSSSDTLKTPKSSRHFVNKAQYYATHYLSPELTLLSHNR